MTKNSIVTLIVINYNSYKRWEVVEQCIKSIFQLKYKPLEVMFVDNGSTDGSYERLKNLVEHLKNFNKDVKARVIRLSKNYGFAIANLIAYRLINHSSKYVALVNNDLAPDADSLERLIDILERNPRIAGVQGIILTWNGERVDSYGGLATDHGSLYAIGHSLAPHTLSKPIPVTYVDGAFSIYRVEAIEKCGGLFHPYFFMWGDDYELGIRLWRCGYTLMTIPIVVGRHYRGLTTNGWSFPYVLEYWSWTSNIAVMVVLYGHPWIVQLLKRVPTTIMAALMKRSKAIIRGFIDGLRLGIKLRWCMYKQRPWIKTPREPKLKVKMLHELTLLVKLYLKYKLKASRIYYVIITRSLGRAFCK